jgi:hypothetical protein
MTDQAGQRPAAPPRLGELLDCLARQPARISLLILVCFGCYIYGMTGITLWNSLGGTVGLVALAISMALNVALFAWAIPRLGWARPVTLPPRIVTGVTALTQEYLASGKPPTVEQIQAHTGLSAWRARRLRRDLDAWWRTVTVPA